jgi:hypothetical protein
MSLERQPENHAEHFQRRRPSQFANAGAVEQASHLESVKKINAVFQADCLLLLKRFLTIFHKPFPPVFIMFLPNTIYQVAKGFFNKKYAISTC